MEFPDAKLTHPLRLAILIIFVIAFFILTPLIIAYTMGYRYDWQNHEILTRGAINIDVLPETARVFIDGREQKSSPPLRLKDIMPGKYLVKITADNFYDWQKIVEVKSKQTVYIKDIAMIKKNRPELIVATTAEHLELSANGEYLVYLVKEKNNRAIYLRAIKTNEEKNILRLPTDADLKFSWAKNNNYLAISDTVSPHNILHLINADQPNEQLDVVRTIHYPVNKFQWKDTREPELYYSTALKIVSLLPGSAERLVLTDNIYEDWYMEGDRLWAISRATGTEKIKIMEDVLGFANIFADENAFGPDEQKLTLKTARSGHLLLQKNDREEMILLTKNKKFNLPGTDFLISDFNDWWLIWTPWEVWTYLPGDEPLLLTRAGEQLRNITPLDKHNTLALNWAEKTTTLFPYYLVGHDLITNPVRDIRADTKNRYLYFLATVDNQTGIWRLEY